MPKLTCYTDNGPWADMNDCVIRSYALAESLPYEHVSREFTALGRKPNKGCWDHQIIGYANECGYPVLFPGVAPGMKNRPTLAAFSRGRGGRWVVMVRGHALALIDGEYQDWRSLVSKTRRIVRYAIRVE